MPDFARTEFLMCLGTNPMVSQMSVLSIPNAIGKLQEIEARGGRVVMVDPRRTETAEKLKEHHFIRPGTDVFLLLAMLHVLGRERPKAAKGLDTVAHGAEAFLAIGRDWSPARVAAITGIEAATIEDLARAYLSAKGASLYMSTGVNMGPFGSVCYWLIQGLSLLSGNLDRAGGMVFREGPYNGPRLWALMDVGGESSDRTLVNNLEKVSGAFPISALAEEIKVGHSERVRALFINAGNPAHSVPGGELGPAMKQLDLLVCVDIFHNETNAQADYLLPATGMLERSDFPLSWMVLQNEPWAQHTEAVVPPSHERRPEWEIFSDLAQACGVPRIGLTTLNLLPRLNRWLPKRLKITPDSILAALLWTGRKVTLSKLRKAPQGKGFPQPDPGDTLGRRLPIDDRKMSLAPHRLVADLARVEKRAASTAEQMKLLMIGQRDRRTHNSWIKDRTRRDGNRATMHPIDARARNIGDGDQIAVRSNGGEIVVPLQISDEIMPGVISIPHGWGEDRGANVNLVIPGGSEFIEPLSSQAVMSAHAVEVERAPAQG